MVSPHLSPTNVVLIDVLPDCWTLFQICSPDVPVSDYLTSLVIRGLAVYRLRGLIVDVFDAFDVRTKSTICALFGEVWVYGESELFEFGHSLE